MFRSLLLRRLERLETGRVTLVEEGDRIVLGRADAAGLACELTVHDPRFYADVVLGGSIGAGESFMEGRWSADDLTTLIRIFARDRRARGGLEAGAARLKGLVDRAWHRLRPNTLSGSRRNIAAHYDLGNEFFAAFLDPTLTYSCGLFAEEGSTLQEASVRKNDLICRKLELGPHDEVLEIGCGWGGFAIHAAGRYGCRVLGVTLSRRQRDLALERVREAGLEGRVEIVLQDYRRLPAASGRRFDKLVSIEMIEAVGARFLGDYFRVCAELLQPAGSMLLQGIVIADQQYRAYLHSVDFIQRHIFPGGFLPSLTSLCGAMTEASDLRVAHLQDITSHYPRTLDAWRERFRAESGRLESLGFDARFRRAWEFYFGYCAAGFLERNIGVLQLLLARPAAAVPALVPQR